MEEQFKVQYETVGASSYMTLTCLSDAPLVHFQMEMLLSNEIRNFLPVTRQIIDGQTVLYYNITSRIPLGDVLKKRKLTRRELKNLIEGAVLAVREAQGFRLPAEGIHMEPERIFISPGSCQPAFVFIPAAPEREYGLKELVKELVYKDQIEMTNDNLIQILLRELNSQPFSLDRLESSLKAYYGSAPSQVETPVRMSDVQPPYAQVPYSHQAGAPSEQYPYQPSTQPAPAPLKESMAVQEETPQFEKKKKPEVSKRPQKAVREEKSDRQDVPSEEEFDREKAKKKFLLPQAVIFVALSAAVSFGLFQNTQGELQLDLIGAAVVVIVVLEVILYREAYVNGKNKTPKGGKKQKAKKVSGGEHNLPPTPSGSSKRPQAPVKDIQNSYQPQPPVRQEPFQAPPQQPVQQPVQQPLQHSFQEPSWQTAPAPQPPVSSAAFYGRDEAGYGDETELWSGAEEKGQSAYLEYFENGRLTRIPLDPARGVVIGRLKSEVDFAVKSPRVGKIHARFFCQNGQYYVTDINSKNGTYINGSGQRIESNAPWPLHDKDRIMLADCEFTIRCAEG